MENYLTKTFGILTKKNKTYVCWLSFLAVIRSLLEIIGIGLLIPVLTFLSNDEKKESIIAYVPYLKNFNNNEILFIFIIVFLLAYLIKTLFTLFYDWYAASFAHRLHVEISDRVLRNYFKKDLMFFLENNSAIIIRNILQECSKFAIGVVGGGIRMVSNSILILGVCSLLVIYNYYSFFVIVILSTLCFGIFKINDKKFKKWGNINHVESGKFIQKLNEVVGSIKEVILYDKKNFFANQAYQHLSKYAEASIYRDAFQSITSPIIEFISMLIFFGFLSYLIFYSPKEFSEIVIIFGIFAFASIKLLPNFIQLVRHFQIFKFQYPSISIVYNGVKNKEENKKKLNLDNIESIKLEKINFTYPKKSTAILQDVSLEIKSGDKVGIIGESGSGKSTLINLISGLLSPTKGKIKINKFTEFNSTKFKLNIGYVSQSVYLFDDNIINNISLDKKISIQNKNSILEILRVLNLNEFTKKKKRIMLGERGARISGGQMQRIGIARALYRNPSLLVLDEATNSLDERTESKILDHLFTQFEKKIIIFCTHKKKLLKYCNKIIEVKNNKVKVLTKNIVRN